MIQSHLLVNCPKLGSDGATEIADMQRLLGNRLFEMKIIVKLQL